MTNIVVGAPATVMTDGDGVGDHVGVDTLASEVDEVDEGEEVVSGTIGATGVVKVLDVGVIDDVEVGRDAAVSVVVAAGVFTIVEGS